MAVTSFSAPDIECDGCANAIKNAVGRVGGVFSVNVDVQNKTVQVEHEDSVQPAAVSDALDRAGFPAEVVAQ